MFSTLVQTSGHRNKKQKPGRLVRMHSVPFWIYSFTADLIMPYIQYNCHVLYKELVTTRGVAVFMSEKIKPNPSEFMTGQRIKGTHKSHLAVQGAQDLTTTTVKPVGSRRRSWCRSRGERGGSAG